MGTRTRLRPLNGLPSSLADSDRSDANPNEKLLGSELDGVGRGEALGLIGEFASMGVAGASGFLVESSSMGANLVISGADDGPT